MIENFKEMIEEGIRIQSKKKKETAPKKRSEDGNSTNCASSSNAMDVAMILDYSESYDYGHGVSHCDTSGSDCE